MKAKFDKIVANFVDDNTTHKKTGITPTSNTNSAY